MEIIQLLEDRRRLYGEQIFRPVTAAETIKVHNQWPGIVDRISAQMARDLIDSLLKELITNGTQDH